MPCAMCHVPCAMCPQLKCPIKMPNKNAQLKCPIKMPNKNAQ